MIPFGAGDLSNLSMMDLFRQETENQAGILVEGLLALEREPGQKPLLETLMRAAHSLKGAARLVNRDEAVRVAHAMEDCFVAAQKDELQLNSAFIDVLLKGSDLLREIAQKPDDLSEQVKSELQVEVEAFLEKLKNPPEVTSTAPAGGEGPLAALVEEIPDSVVETEVLSAEPAAPLDETVTPVGAQSREAENEARRSAASRTSTDSASQTLVRVSASNIDRLIALAGESVVATRWLSEFGKELLALKRMHASLSASHYRLSESLAAVECDERIVSQAAEIRGRENSIRETLNARIEDMEAIERRLSNLSSNLYHSVLDCRMRPFADGVHGFARMVRDVARSLEKDVDIEILGETTPVDRDVLERIESPLGHLLRNAVDHGLETRSHRRESGKPAAGKIRLEARHLGGLLIVTVEDDGRGIDLASLRQVLLDRKLVTPAMSQSLTEQELLEFLFLPGFTMKSTVTEVSGRGVGLDAVQTMVREVGGTVTVSSKPGHGTKFELLLPLTLSVVRALLFEVSAEMFALPLARATSVIKLSRSQIESTEGRQHFLLGENQIGLVTAHQVLGLAPTSTTSDDVSIIVLGDTSHRYGVVVDRFLDERELVIRPLDPRLGKVQNIQAAALMTDQSPVLIVDTDDFIQSIRHLIAGGDLAQVSREMDSQSQQRRKRVLVVDDSLTVRELERKLIASRGYLVEVAIDGMEAWNAIRTGQYDLVVTDVDMPRMDGIRLVGLIKNDNRLKSLPVMIVSYKDREEDRLRGLEAGADYYLTKASFHDESLLTAVEDLIGEPLI